MEKLLLIFIILALSGCSLCRYQAVANYAKAVEDGHNPEIALYTVNPIISLGIWNAHTQATFKEGGKRYWISNDTQVVSDSPDYSMGEYCWIMTLDEYIKWLKINKELSAKDMPPKEHRDKYWPKSKEVLK